MAKSLFLSLLLFGGFLLQNSLEAVEYPKRNPIIERRAYTLEYDGKNKIPLWTYEYLTNENVSGMIDPRPDFEEDEEIYYLHRSTNSDYLHSGFQRGHMVPDADRDNTWDVLKETYLFSNICPQIGHFNRGVWAKLEQYARNIVQKHGYDSAEVISGPLFLPVEKNGRRYVKYEVIGDNDVAIPTHFFKVIYKHKGNNTITEAYLLPVKRGQSKDLDTYKVTLEKIEKASGLIFDRT